MPHFSHVTNRTQAKSERGLAPFFTQVKHIVTEKLPVQVMMGGKKITFKYRALPDNNCYLFAAEQKIKGKRGLLIV